LKNTYLGLDSGGEDGLHDGGMDVDSTASGRWCCVGIGRSGRFFGGAAEKIEAGGARFGFELGKIGGVAADLEAPFAGVEANDSIGMGSAIVQEMA
jgi:hypothetical protein